MHQCSTCFTGRSSRSQIQIESVVNLCLPSTTTQTASFHHCTLFTTLSVLRGKKLDINRNLWCHIKHMDKVNRRQHVKIELGCKIEKQSDHELVWLTGRAGVPIIIRGLFKKQAQPTGTLAKSFS